MKQHHILFLFLLTQIHAAPAIITVWETVTAATPQGAPTAVPQASVPAAANPPAAAPVASPAAAATPAASTSTGSSGGFWSNLLNSIFDSGSSASTTSTSTTPSTGSSSTASSAGSFLSNLFDSFFGTSSSSAAPAAAPAAATAPSAAPVAALANTAAAVSVPGTSTPSTSSNPAPAAALAKGFPNSNPSTYVPPVSSSPPAVSPAVPSSSSAAQPQSSNTPTSSSSGTSGNIYAAISQSNGVDKSFASSILDAHNQYRSQHQVGPLSWDVDTYNYAKNNADNYDCSGILTHTHGPYGENLAAGFKNGPDTVAAWMNEPVVYTSNGFVYNHLTQVIWKASTKVGCAYKDCSSTGWGLYVVCEYDPYGNVIGEGPQNVFPPS